MRLLLAALVAASAIPGVSASAAPCVVFDPPPPHVEDPCPYSPPEELNDIAPIDSVACPAFASLGPSVAGILDISPDGDITVAGEPFWDCPPYES